MCVLCWFVWGRCVFVVIVMVYVFFVVYVCICVWFVCMWVFVCVWWFYVCIGKINFRAFRLDIVTLKDLIVYRTNTYYLT